MSNTKEFITHLRSKPEHVRQRIAIGASGAVTGLVALVWVVALAANGTFALKSESVAGTGTLANSADTLSPDTASQSGFNQLLGAVGAATPDDASSTPSLTIVDDGSKSTLNSQTAPSNATIIPF